MERRLTSRKSNHDARTAVLADVALQVARVDLGIPRMSQVGNRLVVDSGGAYEIKVSDE